MTDSNDDKKVLLVPDGEQRILIAEDEQAYSKALKLKLENIGYGITIARDGAEALEYLRKEKFDLLLCDLIMPKVTGFAVLEEIRGVGLTVPVIILSNLSQSGDEQKARNLGAADFLVKSNISIAEVVKKIQNLLD